ncbi:hypothetical protein FHX42_005201 [Saccharopolyspora lacisalsi]|uniref:Uncharacterized protein n=1 Tax=Halosaccharopolyspora lacisalsi TaxID=1000566 RepID=A0A839E1T0_9PSEU|nr:hypothetical protein [Halosaccharopolyspora lacisalsi]MBA8827794.1 hypothetical protein [Halosaccharopolyspora lacisalsi]
MRQPWVAGVAGGVGTSTVAGALQAADLGVYRGGPVDAVVCRDTVSSLGRSHQAVQHAGTSPVLLVVATSRAPTSKPAAARITMVRPYVGAVVAVPWVGRWCELVDPWTQAAQVLATAQPDKHLQPFAAAMRQAHRELVAQLRATTPVAAAAPPVSPARGTASPVAGADRPS